MGHSRGHFVVFYVSYRHFVVFMPYHHHQPTAPSLPVGLFVYLCVFVSYLIFLLTCLGLLTGAEAQLNYKVYTTQVTSGAKHLLPGYKCCVAIRLSLHNRGSCWSAIWLILVFGKQFMILARLVKQSDPHRWSSLLWFLKCKLNLYK